MILYSEKLECAITFIKYIAGAVPLIFPPKTLIRNKIVLPASNLLKVLELLKNEQVKNLSKII